MNLKDRIQTTPKKVGKIIVLYGSPGVGKTTFSAQAPECLFMQVKDHSLDVLMDTGLLTSVPYVNADNWDDAMSILKSVETEKPCRVLVIDGISGLEQMCDEVTVDKDFKGNQQKFLDFGRGYKVSADRWTDFLNAIDRIKSAGITVICLAHKGLVEIKNADSDNYFKWTPKLHETKFIPTSQYSDAILRMDYALTVRDVDERTGKGKAVGSSKRYLYCEGEASFEAKNRLGLPSLIDLGKSHTEAWDRFVLALQEGKK